MTGHVRKRGANSWELKFDIGTDPITGKRRVRYRSFRGTKREAAVALANLVSENSKGQFVDASRLTVAEFFERWLTDSIVNHVSPKTFERYAEIVRKHVIGNIGNARLQALKPVDLNRLYALLLRPAEGRALSPRTVGHVHRVMHRAFVDAVNEQVLTQNPASLVKPPRVAAEEIELLTPEVAQQVLRRLRGRSIYPICVLALATGMRRGELLALRWRDLDLVEKAALRVEQSLEQTKAGLRFKAPKTKHGRRTISLPASAVTVLRDHWKKQQEHRLRMGVGKAAPDELVFPRWDGKPRSPNAFTKEWTVAVKAAGLPPASLHSLRHTHASHLIASGLDVLTISRRLGHGTPTITLSVYGHLFPNTDDRAAQIIEATFANATD